LAASESEHARPEIMAFILAVPNVLASSTVVCAEVRLYAVPDYANFTRTKFHRMSAPRASSTCSSQFGFCKLRMWQDVQRHEASNTA
jgi:hypothetical protein